jgi:hypothetical protein
MKSKLLFTIVGLALAYACVTVRFGYIADDKQMTEQAIKQFHARLDAGHFDDIYRDAHELLRQSQSREALLAAMQQTRDRYGRYRVVTYSKLNVIVGAPVQVRAVYNTTYEKGDATEWFVFLKEGDSVKLTSYQIFPGTVKPGESQ